MDPARTLRLLFLLLAAAHVAGLQLQASATAWTGSAALAALLLLSLLPGPAGAVRRWPRHALRVALAALTAVALLVDSRAGGSGWPAFLGLDAAPGGWGPVEAALLAVAGTTAAAAALGAVGPPRSRWLWLLPGLGAVIASLPLVAQAMPSRSARATVTVWLFEAAASAPLHAALILLGFASGALAAARRWAAAAGLAVGVALLLPVLAGVLSDPRIEAPKPAHDVPGFPTGVSWRVYPVAPPYAGPGWIDAPDGRPRPVDTYRPGPDVRFEDWARRNSRPRRTDPPAAPTGLPATSVDLWTTAPAWRAPMWVSSALLLAVAALFALPELSGEDPAGRITDAGSDG